MTLSTPILWVILPLMMAVIIAVFYQRQYLSVILTSITALSLTLLAAFFPENLTLPIGPLTITFVESLSILGRRITLAYEILPFITLIYAMTGIWTLSSAAAGVPITFRPISLTITALVTAALGVQPFLYAALFIETAVLVSIPMLSPMQKSTHAGILRYLSLQTIAMPFILLAGWLLTGVETLPPDSPLVGQTALLLGLGFALWLGVFPFHSWVPMVSEHSHPAVVSFLLFLIPTTIFVFGLNFFDRFTFLRTSTTVYEVLRVIGTLMIVIGGVWTAVQNNLRRAFGFTILSETGFTLLAIGLSQQNGMNWMMMLFPARALGIWLWGHALALIKNRVDSLDFEGLLGFARRFPILSFGLVLAQFSIAGLPLLASFPIKIVLLTATFEARAAIGVWSFIGNLGLFLFTLRLMIYLVAPNPGISNKPWSITENSLEYLPILVAILAIIILGMFPHIILTGITNTLTAFTQLQ